LIAIIKFNQHLSITPPNFYLFPSIKGLCLEIETFPDSGQNGCFVSFGTGLETCGVKTSNVDRLRIGGKYHSLNIPLELLKLSVSLFAYLNFKIMIIIYTIY